jgi:hypothetical protein
MKSGTTTGTDEGHRAQWQRRSDVMFKFLDPTGATYYAGKPFYYHLPAPGQKWSQWTEHPDGLDGCT